MIRQVGWMAWRLHRRGLVGFSAGGFLISFLYGFAYKQAAGSTAASQAAFGRSMSLVAKEFAFLIPLPVHPETLGGYEQYKWLSSVVVLFMIWAAIAGVAVGRGDEERGLTDEWLAGGLSRARLLLMRTSAFALVALIASLASTLGISAVAPLVQQDPNVGGEVLKAASIAAGMLAAYAIALFISQLPAERGTATAFGVGALVLMIIVNGTADTIDAASWIGVISPFHWMERTSTAAPGGTFDLFGTVGLVVAAAAFFGAALAVFERRDVGGGLFTFRGRPAKVVRDASRNVLLRLPATEGLWEQRVGLSVWLVSSFFVAVLMLSVTKSTVDALLADPHLAALFHNASPGPVYASLLGLLWFGTALLILAAYAVVQVSRWAAQDQEGRVEMLLSAPISRTRVVVERAIEFAAASLLIVVGGYLGLAAELPRSGLTIDASRLFTASLLLWPFALAFGGLGVALASRWPRIAVPVLAAFVVLEYVLGDVAPFLQAPGWVANLSIFHLYGNPVVGVQSWTSALAMAAVFVLGFAAAVLLMQRRDVSAA